MHFIKHLERILIEWKGGSVWGAICGHSLFWDVACVIVTDAVKWFTNRNSIKRAQNRNHFPEGVLVGGDARYVYPLHSNNPPPLPWWSKTMLCRVPNEKHFTKAVTKLTTTDTTHDNKGIFLEVEMCVELLQQDHEEWWWRIEQKEPRGCHGKTTGMWEEQQEGWNRTRGMRRNWKGEGRGIERGKWTLCGEICDYGRILNEGQVTKREKMEEKGWKQEARLMELDQISGERWRGIKNRRGVPQGPHNWVEFCCPPEWIAVTIQQQHQNKEWIHGENNHPSHGMPLKEVRHSVRLRWTKGGVEPVGFLSLSLSKAMNFNNPFLSFPSSSIKL